jgi:hypothetical protein
METFIQEPLFELEPEPVKYAEREPSWFIMHDDGTAECPYCGDVSQNEYCASISHNRCWNGWCATRVLCNNGANERQLEWLASHGWEVVDIHDERNWS